MAFVLTVGLLITSAFGADEVPGFKPDTNKKKITVGVLGKALIPYWDVVRLGCEYGAKKMNAEALFQAPKVGDPHEQIKIMEGFIAQGVDIIGFAASDPDSIVPVTQDAVKRGIPVFAFDTDAPKSPRLWYHGTNNFEGGKLAGRKMVELTGGKGEIAMITGSLSAMNAIERMEGFKEGIKGSSLKIVTTENDNEDAFKALQISQAIIQTYPDLVGIYTVYAATGPQTAKAVIEANKVGKIKIVAFDTQPDTLEHCKNNVIQAIIGQRQFFQGYFCILLSRSLVDAGIEETLKLLPADRIVDTGVDVVTPENYSEYIKFLDMYEIPH